MSKYDVQIDASASFNGKDFPQLTLVVDGKAVDSLTVSSNNSTRYSFGSVDVSSSTSHQISILYANHGSSAQMVNVQVLRIGGTAIASNAPVEQYVTASGTYGQTGQMYFAGQLNFALDASYFPASASLAAAPLIAPAATAIVAAAVAPAAIATAAGTKALSVTLAEDAWNGDANAIVKVDGTQVFAGNVTALHGGPGQVIALGSFDSAVGHTISVAFTNDAYGGTGATDRNLFVQSVNVDGAATGASAALYSAGTSTFQIPAASSAAAPAIALGSGSDTLALGISEDAWQGDAQYVVTIDGVQQGETQTATRIHGSGAPQQVTLHGDFSHGARKVAVTFVNDAYAGTASTDRNLYVDSVVLGGTDTNQSAALYSNGAANFTVGAAATPTPVATPAPAPTPALAPPSSGFHVATNGSDSGDGSAAHPFATLQRAADAMAGSSVKTTLVDGGSYNQSLALGAANSGQQFVAASGQTVTLTGRSTFIAINGASNVGVSGFTFNGASGAAITVGNSAGDVLTNNTFVNNGSGVLLGAGSNHVAVTNSKMTGTAFAGVEMKDGTSFNTIDSNLIDGVGPVATETYGGAIYAHGASNSQITHNDIRNTAGAGINLSDFYLTGTETQNLNNTVANNTLHDTDLTSSDSGAIYILGRSLAETGTQVKMNFIDGTGSASQHSVGIYLDDNANGVTVQGNIIRNVGSDAIQVHGGSNNKITGNILDLGAGSPSAVLFQANPSDQPNPSPLRNNTVTGNIITTQNVSPAAFFPNLQGGSPLISGNDYFGPGGGALNTGPDSSAHYTNPGFANAAGGNYATTGGAGIGFVSIDQSSIGLMPSGAHAY